MKAIIDLVERIKEKVSEFEKNKNDKRQSMTTILSHFSQKFERESGWRVGTKHLSLKTNQDDSKVVFGFCDDERGYRGDITASMVNGELDFNIEPSIIQKQFLEGDEKLFPLYLEALAMLQMAAKSNETIFNIVPKEIRPVDLEEMIEANDVHSNAIKAEKRILGEIDDMRAVFVARLNNVLGNVEHDHIDIKPDLSIEYYGKNICNFGTEPREKSFDIDSDEKRGWTNDIAHPRSMRTFAASEMNGLHTQLEQFAQQIFKTPAINDSLADIEEKLEIKKQAVNGMVGPGE